MFYGFGHVRGDSAGFTIPKVRIGVRIPLEKGFRSLKIGYDTYADFASDGRLEIGYASLIVEPGLGWLSEVLVGRTLDPVTYQFPAPSGLYTVNYPAAALLNKPVDTGIFLRKKGSTWVMIGVANGNGKLKDDNKSLDFTSRLQTKLPLGFSVSTVFRNGKQLDGSRVIKGADLSWQWRGLWINSGQNILHYTSRKTACWVWGTMEVFQELQLVGLFESLKVNDRKATYGWTAGLNFRLGQHSVIRADYFKSAENQKFGWAILAQRVF